MKGLDFSSIDSGRQAGGKSPVKPSSKPPGDSWQWAANLIFAVVLILFVFWFTHRGVSDSEKTKHPANPIEVKR